MSEKIYIGSGKEKTFSNGGSIINIHLPLDGLKELFEKYGYTSKNGKHILKINVSKRQEVSQYGETHSVSVDTWKPDGAYGQSGNNLHDQYEDDPPF